ncbi:cobaltochelatase CobT-related protein [Varunaivibrio sulfuroxidans]|uniref:Cobaltochelatase CobT subunit n=1 Tax=Varunaivibrio sulfuroxidans TaxID=1773489 RepID=A0A4R3JCW6_9PROT|nr:cobaltochelatase subunit CobT [Varunaivibrio sulfuroxidans]TCS63514.1 cobaltochelatase CobT subunit [Varunaivibrio sulfuroxidans]WES30341.1 cobaltochelatase subunit CobT [Varunaivibrio sulfuroxidans]
MALNPPERPSDTLKRATQATLKALAREKKLTVQFSEGERVAYLAGDAAVLPAPPAVLDGDQITQLRGAADALAMRLYYHDDAVHRVRQPKNPDARALFNALEQARVEALGGRRFAGMRHNLDHLLERRAQQWRDSCERDPEQLVQAVSVLARERLSGEELPGAARHLATLWRAVIDEKAADLLDRLADSAADQETYAKIAGEVVRALELLDEYEGQPEQDEQDDEQAAPDEDETDQDRDGEGDEQPAGALAEDSEMGESGEGGEGGDGEASDEMMQGGEDPAGPSEAGADWPQNAPRALAAYHAYCTDFDEVVAADALCQSEELSRLRDQLDAQLSRFQSVVGKLANRLQRLLQAKQLRNWEFDLEEGMLDTARLSRVVTDPLSPLSFKMESDMAFKDTVVSLLIDNSGSMRGRPITIAAISADILARTLERCGVQVEILGFTTRAWKGGHARQRWLDNGKPENPGRLNDLRHIVYKSADQPWRRARRNLGLMLREGILKENIDGEALLWAHERLLGRFEQRRILMVISDGAPVDDATLSANSGNYLEKHLRDVIHWIENKSDIELCAIGIGHDVTRYYQRAVTITDAEDLGGAMMRELADLFNEDATIAPPGSRRAGRR